MAKNDKNEVAVATPPASTGLSKLAQKQAQLAAYVEANNIKTFKYISYDGQVGSFKTKDEDRNVVPLTMPFKAALNFPEIYHGYVCWVAKQVKGTEWFKLDDVMILPEVESLPDHGPYDEKKREGWSETYGLPFYVTEGKDKGEYVLETSGKVIVNAIKQLIGKVISGGADGHDFTLEAPIVEITIGKYFNKGQDKFFPLPVFKIVGWEPYANLNMKVTASKEEKTNETTRTMLGHAE